MTFFRRFRRLSALALGAFALRPLAVRADAGSFALDYWVPEGCTPASEFVASVRARTHPDRWDHAAAYSVSVRAVATGRRFTARLSIDGPGAQPMVRSVDGATCPEVALALSLIVALAIDPEQRLPEPAPLPKPAELPAPHAQARSVTWAMGAGGVVRAGLSPSVAPGVAVFADLGVSGVGGRLAVSYLPKRSSAVDGGTMDASLLAATLDACPLRVGPWDGLLFDPCVSLSAGLLDVRGAPEGIYVSLPRERRLAWAAAGIRGRVEARLYGGLWAELEADALLSLSRKSFVFTIDGQDQTVFAVPLLTLGGALSLAYHFP